MRWTLPLLLAKSAKPKDLSLDSLKSRLTKVVEKESPRKKTNKTFFEPNHKKKHKKPRQFQAISWAKGYEGSNSKARTSYQAKSEFDFMIKDWITTNWLNVDQVSIQKKPCHFFIHDRMVFEGSVFEAVRANAESAFNKELKGLKQRWDDELSTMTLPESSAAIVEKKLKELVKTVFYPSLRAQGVQSFDSFVNSPDFQADLVSRLGTQAKVNARMRNYLQNFQNLNVANHFTFIKDSELSLVPGLDSRWLVNQAQKNSRLSVFDQYSVLDYSHVFGNKVNDFANMDKIVRLLNSRQDNPYFLILSADKSASLEFYRLLKLLRSVDKSSKKGCVIFLNEAATNSSSFFPPDSKRAPDYSGQAYNVVGHFGEIYDVFEAL